MIFVTVGTDLPFNRMVKTVDDWARSRNRSDVFAQIGHTEWKPEYIEYTNFISPADFPSKFQKADIIIAHAGMGTILSALRYGKPILVMPRRATLGEQRNEHQQATARRLNELHKITVAFNDDELINHLENLHSLKPLASTGKYASDQLIQSLKSFIYT